MIRLTRLGIPDDLNSRLAALTQQVAERDEADRLNGARRLWKHSAQRRNVHRPLTDVLRQMAPGMERCMYCGDSQGTAIDHHEPMARNPLRTFDWLNHLLACTYCNSHEKRDRFPLDRNGQPLLIDPSAEDPFDHLQLTLTLGVYRAKGGSPKGQTTIDVCGLNRPILTKGRVHAKDVVIASLCLWQRGFERSDTHKMNQAVRTIWEQPFADVCQAMLRQAGNPAAKLLFDDDHELLALLSKPELREELLR